MDKTNDSEDNMFLVAELLIQARDKQLGGNMTGLFRQFYKKHPCYSIKS